jgi:phosphoserine phosphatase RsbU/P
MAIKGLQGPSRVLVVDDTPANITLMKGLLKDRYRVQAATSGEKALQIAFSDTPPDIILLDVMMPGLDGHEVCRMLRADQRTKHLPIIFLTARSEAEDEEKGLLLGAVDYLIKPISPSIALARIHTHLTLYQQRKQLWEAQQIMSQEIAEAADYVRALLPGPLRGSVQTAWRHIPCNALGGDAFGYHWIDEDRLAIYLLDVCGHGVSAALLSISVINSLRSQSLRGVDFGRPSSVLRALNDSYPMEEHNEKYFTIWYGVYSKSRNEIAYASGGHPPALLLSGDDNVTSIVHHLVTPNPAIGAFPGLTFDERRLTLGRANKLFVFSDGVYEFRGPDGQMMTLGDFLNLLKDYSDMGRFETEDVLKRMQGLAVSEDAFEDDFSLLELVIEA